MKNKLKKRGVWILGSDFLHFLGIQKGMWGVLVFGFCCLIPRKNAYLLIEESSMGSSPKSRTLLEFRKGLREIEF